MAAPYPSYHTATTPVLYLPPAHPGDIHSWYYNGADTMYRFAAYYTPSAGWTYHDSVCSRYIDRSSLPMAMRDAIERFEREQK